MVVLKNIKIDGDIISSDYYPESNEKERGYVEMNIRNGELVKIDYSPCKYWKDTYITHAKHGLQEIVSEFVSEGKPLPEKHTVMWY